eukprot:3764332-Alexandrium_andersonii.AAC.1
MARAARRQSSCGRRGPARSYGPQPSHSLRAAPRPVRGEGGPQGFEFSPLRAWPSRLRGLPLR